MVPGRRARVVFELLCRLGGSGKVCYGSLLRRCAAPRRDSAPWLLHDGWQTCLACRTSRVAGALFCNARGWHTLAATPHHFTTTSHPGACAGAPAWRRRVPRVASNPNPNPIGQKFVSSPPSIIIAKALPFAHCTLKTFESSVAHRCCGCPSLLRLPRGCKNHHGYPPAQRAAHGPRGPI